MTNIDTKNADFIRRKYAEDQPSYEKLVEEVKFTIGNKLKDRGLKVAAMVGRVKSEESLMKKVSCKRYDDPLSEITDLAGVRVICLYEEDTEQVAKLVRDSFEVIEATDKTSDLGSDRMGYHGLHIIIQLGSGYSGTRYNGLKGLVCEVQIRTVLQDAWALISHHLVYKSDASVPDRLKRHLNNVSALLDIAQGIFDNMRDRRDNYIEEIQKKQDSRSEFLAQPIDHDTLSAYTKWKFPDLPISHVLQEKLITDLNHNRFTALRDINRAVEAASDAVSCYQRENPDWFKFGTDFITKSLGFVDTEFREKHGFAERTRQAFEKYAHMVKDPMDDA